MPDGLPRDEPVEDESAEDAFSLELDLYLRVWHVLYPDADVELVGD